MPITAFDHYTIRCADLTASWAFYRDALGLRVEPRPLGQASEGAAPRAALVFLDGEWLVHLFQATPEQEAVFGRMRPHDSEAAHWRTGRMQHIALRSTGLAELRARLQQHGVAFREQPRGERYQIVLNDPDGVELEINFPIGEAN
jgi:catechol 2,3-dioxygenase-like lactoylglutathione lyase family enzyme